MLRKIAEPDVESALARLLRRNLRPGPVFRSRSFARIVADYDRSWLARPVAQAPMLRRVWIM